MNEKPFHIIFLFCLILAATGMNSHAQDQDMRWAIKPSYSLLQYKGELGNQFLDFAHRNDGVSLRFSRYLSSSFDATMGIDFNRLLLEGDLMGNTYSMKGPLISAGVGLNYKFSNGYILKETSRIQPYVGVDFNYLGGVTKGLAYDANANDSRHTIDEVELDLVGGLKYAVTPRISAFVEYHEHFATAEEWDGAFIDFANDKLRGFKVGLCIKLGRNKDSDGDGVIDDDDDCPDTPLGVEVDENGCPKDRDLDGIPDYQDDCPDIPGLPEFNGCPDTDGDGIPDKEDDCPELPGLLEYNGCPDTDGDGVIDPKDLCPDTPMGVKVDEYGCPIDSDGDGMTDDIDQCPDEYGPIEYNGCPEPPDAGWPDFKQETPPEVYFEYDKSELTPEAEAELGKIVRNMFENPSFKIRLSGFADPRGSAEYNLNLSKKRVESVKKYLMKRGIPENRIYLKGVGELQEVGADENESQEEQYRRARKVQFQTFFFME